MKLNKIKIENLKLKRKTYLLLIDVGYSDVEKLKNASDAEIMQVKGIGPATLKEIREKITSFEAGLDKISKIIEKTPDLSYEQILSYCSLLAATIGGYGQIKCVNGNLVDIINDTLKSREKTVIQETFGLDGSRPLTLTEVANLHDVTRERIRQIMSKALRKLQGVILGVTEFAV